ncbi:MAG TPA: hypothetical protein VHR18_01625 [Solirubrobacterales bacterium]|jgi:hypothetical protein|nr:hypothetical protein [Solirubrobacterales bacterium]
MRLAIPIAIVVLAAALVGGCGSSDEGGSEASTATAPKRSGQEAPAGASAQECAGKVGAATALRATGVSCKQAKALAKAWAKEAGCAPVDGSSRSSCQLEGDYDCLAAMTGRGLAVSCARPGRSVAFTIKS